MVFGFVAAEGWAVAKVPVEEQADELAAGAKEAVHVGYIFFPEGRVKGAEKGLFDDEIVLACELEEISCYNLQEWVGDGGELFAETSGEQFGYIHQGNRSKIMVQ